MSKTRITNEGVKIVSNKKTSKTEPKSIAFFSQKKGVGGGFPEVLIIVNNINSNYKKEDKVRVLQTG